MWYHREMNNVLSVSESVYLISNSPVFMIEITYNLHCYWALYIFIFFSEQYKQTNKLRSFSPQANYTDRATASCRRS
jgi:hypothetical protein